MASIPNMYERKHIKPAILRPGMYAGEQGPRNMVDWLSDAVAEYLNAKAQIARNNIEDLIK